MSVTNVSFVDNEGVMISGSGMANVPAVSDLVTVAVSLSSPYWKQGFRRAQLRVSSREWDTADIGKPERVTLYCTKRTLWKDEN